MHLAGASREVGKIEDRRPPCLPSLLPQLAGFSLLKLALHFLVVLGWELPRTSRTFRAASQVPPGVQLPLCTRPLPDARLPGCPLACFVHWTHCCALFWLLSFVLGLEGSHLPEASPEGSILW